ncbi:MAG: molybdopterin-guanine dinucleotide biosynthesis protein B [Aquificaceae bacterium]
MPKLVYVSGYHNSGKTTFIEKLVKELKERGLKVGYIKHDPKGHAITDKEGSDTHRLFELLDRVALIGGGKLTLWDRIGCEPNKVVESYFSDFDVVVLEGWKGLKNVKRIVIGEIDLEGLKLNQVKDLEDVIDYVLS